MRFLFFGFGSNKKVSNTSTHIFTAAVRGGEVG